MEQKATEPNCGLLCLLLPQLFHPPDPTLRRGESWLNRRRPGYNRQTSYAQDCFYVPTPNDQDDKMAIRFIGNFYERGKGCNDDEQEDRMTGGGRQEENVEMRF